MTREIKILATEAIRFFLAACRSEHPNQGSGHIQSPNRIASVDREFQVKPGASDL